MKTVMLEDVFRQMAKERRPVYGKGVDSLLERYTLQLASTELSTEQAVVKRDIPVGTRLDIRSEFRSQTLQNNKIGG